MLSDDFMVGELLCELVEELLDAHEDTVRLIVADAGDERWREHADLLRSLQRVGHEALAAVALGR